MNHQITQLKNRLPLQLQYPSMHSGTVYCSSIVYIGSLNGYGIECMVSL